MSEENEKERARAVGEIRDVINKKMEEIEAEISGLLVRREKIKIFQETEAEFEKLTIAGLVRNEDFDLGVKDRVFGTLQQKIDKYNLMLDDLNEYLNVLGDKYGK